jgi:putative hydrolase of the HAD superfamily
VTKSPYRFLLCDLDNTLYPANSGVMQAVGQLIVRYMIERVGLPAVDVERLKRRYFQDYGTTMVGLILHHAIDPEDYLVFVHDLALEQYLQPAPALDAMLGSIPLRKAVFTNADRGHAERVLGVLGVRRHFEWIIDVRDFGFNCKPHPSAYRHILEIVGASPGECIMVEDALSNLAPAQAMGMLTVLVGDHSPGGNHRQAGADLCIPDILGLADAIAPFYSLPYS